RSLVQHQQPRDDQTVRVPRNLELAQLRLRGNLCQRPRSVARVEQELRVTAERVRRRTPRVAGTDVQAWDTSAEQLHLVEPAEPVEQQRLGIEREVAGEPGRIAAAQEDERAVARDQQPEEDLDDLVPYDARQIGTLHRAGLDQELADR